MFPIILGQRDVLSDILIILFMLIIASLLMSILGNLDIIRDWWDALFGNYDYDVNTAGTQYGYSANNTNKKTYKPPKTTYPVKKLDKWGLYPNERHSPPKASFFERVDGQERSSEGPWEEVHLSTTEKAGWDKQKASTAVISNRNNTKTREEDDSKAFLEQYPLAGGYRG